MAGEFVEHPPSDCAAYLRQKFPQAKNICSGVPEYSGNRKPEHYSNWSDAADIDVTIVRSPLAIAETGSVLLTETELETELLVNTIGLLAHDIVILLDPKDIVENIHHALSAPRLSREQICCADDRAFRLGGYRGKYGASGAGCNDFNCHYVADRT